MSSLPRTKREYEKNAKSSLLVNQLKLKHKRAELAASEARLTELKRALRSERSRRAVRKPDLVLPRAVEALDPLTPEEERIALSVRRFLEANGDQCGDPEGGGGGNWPDNTALSEHLAKEFPRLHLGLPFTRR